MSAGDLARVLDDAIAAAAAGDAERCRRLLVLATRMAECGGDIRPVLAAADAIRGMMRGRRGLAALADVEAKGLPLRIQDQPPRPLATLPRSPERASAPPIRRARRWALVIASGAIFLATWTVWSSGFHERRIAEAEAALAAGDGARAVELLAGETAPRAALLRGEGRLLAGDSVGAVDDLVAGARADSHPGKVAWEAAERLSELDDRRAAEAYLLAYAAGAPRSRWERIAGALERVDRRIEARRIRERL